MRASPVLRAWITANYWASSSVDPPSSLVKSNDCPGFRVSGIPARTLRLKLNPLLVVYTRGFITAVEVWESSTTISQIDGSVYALFSITLIELAKKKVGALPGT
jgi:hypothetical protein